MIKPEGRKITSIAPISGLIGALPMMLEAEQAFRGNALTDELSNNITIDTVCASDTNVWETGIFRESIENKWVIVGQYESEVEAQKGHKNWVEYLRGNPDCELVDINIWNL